MSVRDKIARLGIYLCMRIEVGVAEWAIDSARGAVLITVRPDIRIVMRQSHACGNAPFVVSKIEVVVVRRLANQCWAIRAPEPTWETCLRGCVAVVRANAHAVEHAGQEAERLRPT